jgi:hypothetical protein
MPVNVKYDPALPFTGSLVPQEVFPGDSTDQLEGLVDLLMNYDQYAAEHNQITPRVREQAKRAQELQPQTETPDGTTPETDAPQADTNGNQNRAPADANAQN